MGFDFERVDAHDYAEFRAGYAPEANSWIAMRCGVGPGSTAVDVGAGPGQLAIPLSELGAEVWAIDPAVNMRAELAAAAPEIRILDGTAEALPIPDDRIDLVVSGQAFHHFRVDEALEEMHRALRADGALAVFWTNYADDPLDSKIEALVQRFGADNPARAAVVARTGVVPVSGLFSEPERRLFPGSHEIASIELPDLLATSSDVASLPDESREALLAELGQLAATLPKRIAFDVTTEVELRFRR